MSDEATIKDETEFRSKDKSSGESRLFNVSVRGLITMVVVGTICYMGIAGLKVEEPLYSMSFLCLGYYFGQGNKTRTDKSQIIK